MAVGGPFIAREPSANPTRINLAHADPDVNVVRPLDKESHTMRAMTDTSADGARRPETPYSAIPLCVLRRIRKLRLPPLAQWILIEYLGDSTDRGESTISVPDMARRLDVCEGSVARANRLLVSRHLVQRSFTPGGRAITEMLWTEWRPCRAPEAVARRDEPGPGRPTPPPQEPGAETSSGTESPQAGKEVLERLREQRSEVSRQLEQPALSSQRRLELLNAFSAIEQTLLRAQRTSVSLHRATPERPRPTQPKQDARAARPRTLPSNTRAQIANKVSNLPRVSAPKGLCAEIEFAITRGVFRERSPEHGINICLRLIREHRWRTPWGFGAAHTAPTGVA